MLKWRTEIGKHYNRTNNYVPTQRTAIFWNLIYAIYNKLLAIENEQNQHTANPLQISIRRSTYTYRSRSNDSSKPSLLTAIFFLVLFYPELVQGWDLSFENFCMRDDTFNDDTNDLSPISPPKYNQPPPLKPKVDAKPAEKEIKPERKKTSSKPHLKKEKVPEIDLVDRDGHTKLMLAAQWLDRQEAYDQVQKLLEKGANVEIKNTLGNTVLIFAVIQNDLLITELLLKAGANPNVKNNHDFAPIHYACQRGYYEIVGMLIQHEADLNISLNNQFTPFYLAAQNGWENIAKLLVQHGADPNKYIDEKMKRSSLHYAVVEDNVDMIKILTAVGANLEITDSVGETPLFYAIKHQRYAAAKVLVESGARIDAKNRNSFTPLFGAVDKEDNAITDFLLKNGADPHNFVEGNTPFSLAIEKNKVKLVQVFLDNNININVRYIHEYSPLMIATEIGLLEIIKLLIERGANINLRNENGETALHIAVPGGDIEILSFLIMNGADISIVDNQGRNPLHSAQHFYLTSQDNNYKEKCLRSYTFLKSYVDILLMLKEGDYEKTSRALHTLPDNFRNTELFQWHIADIKNKINKNVKNSHVSNDGDNTISYFISYFLIPFLTIFVVFTIIFRKQIAKLLTRKRNNESLAERINKKRMQFNEAEELVLKSADFQASSGLFVKSQKEMNLEVEQFSLDSFLKEADKFKDKLTKADADVTTILSKDNCDKKIAEYQDRVEKDEVGYVGYIASYIAKCKEKEVNVDENVLKKWKDVNLLINTVKVERHHNYDVMNGFIKKENNKDSEVENLFKGLKDLNKTDIEENEQNRTTIKKLRDDINLFVNIVNALKSQSYQQEIENKIAETLSFQEKALQHAKPFKPPAPSKPPARPESPQGKTSEANENEFLSLSANATEIFSATENKSGSVVEVNAESEEQEKKSENPNPQHRDLYEKELQVPADEPISFSVKIISLSIREREIITIAKNLCNEIRELPEPKEESFPKLYRAAIVRTLILWNIQFIECLCTSAEENKLKEHFSIVDMKKYREIFRIAWGDFTGAKLEPFSTFCRTSIDFATTISNNLLVPCLEGKSITFPFYDLERNEVYKTHLPRLDATDVTCPTLTFFVKHLKAELKHIQDSLEILNDAKHPLEDKEKRIYEKGILGSLVIIGDLHRILRDVHQDVFYALKPVNDKKSISTETRKKINDEFFKDQPRKKGNKHKASAKPKYKSAIYNKFKTDLNRIANIHAEPIKPDMIPTPLYDLLSYLIGEDKKRLLKIFNLPELFVVVGEIGNLLAHNIPKFKTFNSEMIQLIAQEVVERLPKLPDDEVIIEYRSQYQRRSISSLIVAKALFNTSHRNDKVALELTDYIADLAFPNISKPRFLSRNNDTNFATFFKTNYNKAAAISANNATSPQDAQQATILAATP